MRVKQGLTSYLFQLDKHRERRTIPKELLKIVMVKFENVIVRAVVLTALIDISTSLKCANCFWSQSLCDKQKDCSADKVCYTRKRTFPERGDMYEAGCGLRETHCGDQTTHSIYGGLLGRLRAEVKCCDSGDMCNTYFTFSTDQTATPPPFHLSNGIECQVCSGPTCGVKGDDPMVRCPNEFPYCMNVVLNEASGSKMVTKRCAKRSECQRKEDSACVNFDPSEIYPNSMECIYCCETNGCNKDIVPRAETLVD